MKKRLYAALVSLCMIVSMLPTMAFAEAGAHDSGIVTGASGLCEHHIEHTADCGYTEGTAEIPCSHEHTEGCYTLVTECVHEHTAECYPSESVSENTATPSEPEEAEPTACTHECSEESGCITKTLACNHTHDEACGYAPATEGTPCAYICEICNPQDSGNPEAPSDAQPEECTCETRCTEEEINRDCPVCSAEDAELDKVCVGAALLLAAPTLRTGGIELYVGGQPITESGCYENQNGTWTKVDGTEPANGQFYYDGSGTLTLNEAKISYDQTVTVGEGHMYFGSVIAFSQSTDVSLNIVLSQGTSTITGTGGLRVMSKAGDASLSISGPGSLEVKNVTKDSGIVLIGSKDVNLNIDHADVTISDAEVYGVHLFPGDECKITATVNDGNLTAIGSNVGIYFSWLNNIKGPSSLTVSGNAMVDTEGSTGGIINGSPDNFQIGADSESGGIVFNGKNGTVYGKVELQEDLEIKSDETLTIDENASLTVPVGTTLTNNGTITNNGTVTVAEGGTFNNQGSLACNHHIGGTATCTERAKCSLCGEEYGDIGPHSLTKTEAKAATCTEAGNMEYWTCGVCGKLFEDENGQTPTTSEATVAPAAGHNYGEPVWSWSEDGKACAVTFTCKNDETHKESPAATVTSAIKTPAACTQAGVTTYTASVEFGGQTYTAAKDVADIPATGHKYANGKCTACGAADPNYKPSTPNPTPTPVPAPAIVGGAESTWRKGSGVGLTFTSDADFAGFQGVMVDGTAIPAEHYTAKAGSTIVTLKASYLETLSVGSHTMAIVSDAGTAGARFAIVAGTGTPQTGDNSNLALWMSLLGISSAAFAGTFLVMRKRKQ